MMRLSKVTNFSPVTCIEVHQGFSNFYVCAIKAKDLLRICQPIRAEVLDGEVAHDPLDIGLFRPSGPQRKVAEKRPEQIAKYISSGMAAFPNSIIIGANLTDEGFLLEEAKWEWNVVDGKLIVQDEARVAAIIDGQHRLQGYELIRQQNPTDVCLEDELVCSVYLNLPITYHAQLFATINTTQRKVPKNLIYQLYQIDMDEKQPKYWSPEVLSVYLARALGLDPNSPLHNKLVLAIDKGESPSSNEWKVSLSAVVEGLLKLYSSRPFDDRDQFYAKSMEEKTRNVLKNDGSPWRHLYLENKDREIYENLVDFLSKFFNFDTDNDSAFKSSIGISSILEVLSEVLKENSGNYEKIKDRITESLKSIKFSDISKDKTTKNKKNLKEALFQAFSVKSKDI